AAPTATDVLEAPASRIASVKRIWEPPGARMPASANAHTPLRSTSPRAPSTPAATRHTASPVMIVAAAAASAPGIRTSAIRSATVIAPNRAAEASASATGSTRRRPYKSEGALSGAFALTGRCDELDALAHFLLGLFPLVLALADLLLGLTFLLAHLVVGELAFLLLQLALDAILCTCHDDPLLCRSTRDFSPANRAVNRLR